jgi:hypothetical protein
MRTVFWSAKGGSGVTVTAAALALATPSCLLVDACGDSALVLGVDEPAIGLLAWMHSPHDVDSSSLDRLVISVRPGLDLLPAGTTQPESLASESVVAERFALLGEYLALRSNGDYPSAKGRKQQRALMDRSRASLEREAMVGSNGLQWSNVIVDAGMIVGKNGEPTLAFLDSFDRSLLMVKSCFLAVAATIGQGNRTSRTKRIDGLVVLRDEERRISDYEISAALGLPVLASILLQPAVARAVDAGLLASRLPRSLTRSLAALHPPEEPKRTPRRLIKRLPVTT